MNLLYRDVFDGIRTLAHTAPSLASLMEEIVSRLGGIPRFDWVGFYLLEGDEQKGILVLGPYRGAETPHQRIPLDKGLCGAAARSGSTVIVDDVQADSRYLACSTETKSEIVAPIVCRGRVAGELDIDSHTPAAFGLAERELVEGCAAVIGQYLERGQQGCVGEPA